MSSASHLESRSVFDRGGVLVLMEIMGDVFEALGPRLKKLAFGPCETWGEGRRVLGGSIPRLQSESTGWFVLSGSSNWSLQGAGHAVVLQRAFLW